MILLYIYKINVSIFQYQIIMMTEHRKGINTSHHMFKKHLKKNYILIFQVISKSFYIFSIPLNKKLNITSQMKTLRISQQTIEETHTNVLIRLCEGEWSSVCARATCLLILGFSIYSAACGILTKKNTIHVVHGLLRYSCE